MSSTEVPLRPSDLLITDELGRRPHKPADLAGEVAAFHDLAAIILDAPEKALQRFMELAIALTGAGSAGLSLVDEARGEFMWEALAGVYAPHQGGTTPLDFSPCALCLSEAKTILLDRPGRVFEYFNAVTPGIVEGLIVPLYDTGKRALGTLWIVSHDEATRFCATDARIMEQLAVQLVLAIKRRDELRERAEASGALHQRLSDLIEARALGGFLKTVLDATPDCIKVLDGEGRIVFMSAAGLKAIGAADVCDVAGREWVEFWQNPLSARAALQEALAGRPTLFNGICPDPAGQPRWWEVQLTLMGGMEGAPPQIVAISRDITEKREAELHQQLLINELNHRVKNSLATVQSVAMQSFRHAPSLKAAQRSFEDRLMALSRVHDVLTRENWEGAGLHEVVTQALSPYVSDAGERFHVKGPKTRLNPKQALAISMGLQELATNALKYGALSEGGGKVQVDWTVRRSPRELSLIWRECEGPAVELPTKRGFGSRLLERGLSQELSAAVSLDFDPAGVVCRMQVPLH